MEHSGIKIPFFAFFAHDPGRKKRVKEAPWNMLVAMGIAAAFCIGLGCGYQLLYRILPFTFHHEYHPYTGPHVINQLQLLMFATLAFVVLVKLKVYPAEVRSENLDTDWVYRKLLPVTLNKLGSGFAFVDTNCRRGFMALLRDFVKYLSTVFGENGLMGRTWTTSAMAVWATVLLGICLMLYYLN